MRRGDHVYVERLGYTHHGIDVGDATVVHYTGEVGQKSDAAIRQTSLDSFAKDCKVHVREYAICDPVDVTMRRALSRLGENEYDLVFNNCEHFAVWCKTGKHESEQVADVSTGVGGTVGTGTVVAAGIGTVSAVGSVAGLSGAGIMSGLATVGATVTGGAVAGIALLGAAPAAAATGTMLLVLKDDARLGESEREARKIGRRATVAGAVGGSTAAVGAVAALGTTGLSAAGITSGLAAIGSIVGGGMAAGVAISAAAPAIAAAAVGYGAYRLWKKSRSKTPG